MSAKLNVVTNRMMAKVDNGFRPKGSSRRNIRRTKVALQKQLDAHYQIEKSRLTKKIVINNTDIVNNAFYSDFNCNILMLKRAKMPYSYL